MKLMVVREACCAQDDQIGPLVMRLELPQACRLDEFLAEVERSGFLQFSSTHTRMTCRMGATEVAQVFTPHRLFARAPLFLVPRKAQIAALAGVSPVEFLFRHEAAAPRTPPS